MPSNYTDLVITWYDESDSYVTNAAITIDVMGLPIFSDSGSGEINNCTLFVKAPYGRRITTTSPVSIDEFDRIHISLTDGDGNPYSRYFEIEKINEAIANNSSYLQLQAIEALKAIAADPSAKIYFTNGSTPQPMPLLHMGQGSK